MTDTKPERDPQFNLEQYLKNLTLEPMVHAKRAPPMPPTGCRSLTTPLIMRPGGYRNLEDIKPLDCLEDEVTSFFNKLNISVGNCEAVKALKLMSQVPTKNMETIYFGNPYEVDGNPAALFVIERSPIKSVSQLVQTINPELQDLSFYSPGRSLTLSAQKLDPMYFCTRDEHGILETVKCVVIALPPWDFAPRDFEDFTTMDMFEDGCLTVNGTNVEPPWCNADRMWAYLHDLCLMQDCHHFVLTTYEQWAFGAFSNYYTTGFVSPTIPWDAKPNSVLELFTYWILDSCLTENTIIMEKVPREKNYDPDMLEQARNLCRERLSKNEHMGAEATLISDEQRPHKRARKDPLEDRTGWQPLSQHADALFQSPTRVHFFPPQESTPSKSIAAAGSSRGSWTDTEEEDDVDMFARPSLNWNMWYNKRKRDELEDKENPEHAQQNDKLPDEAPKLAARPKFGHPIPCYSSDIDRDNDRFRPELVRFLISHPNT